MSTTEKTLLPDGSRFPFWDDRTEYGRIYHVAQLEPGASNGNPGTLESPFQTIARAAEVLEPGGSGSHIIRGNRIADCGVWLDSMNTNCRVTGNLFHNIVSCHGAVFMEYTDDVNLIDHNVFDTAACTLLRQGKTVAVLLPRGRRSDHD